MMIYDQHGRPYPKTEKKPDRRPLAAAPLTNSMREYVTAGLTPEKLAAIFREADTGDLRRQAELFEQIEEKDGHLIGETGKRKNTILDIDFTVSPATDDARDQKIADEAELFLSGITEWDDVLVSLQDAVGKGYSALEIFWDVSADQADVEKLEFIEQNRFYFTDGSGILSRTPLLITDDEPLGIEIPAWRTIFHRYGGKSGHPVRSGIYRVCAWMWLIKNYSVKDWVIFCEVYGMPLRLGKYDSSASQEDRDALELAVRMLGSDAAGIISESTKIEFVTDSKGSVSGDIYKDLATFANKEMSKAILGQTLSAEVDGKGSYAASKTHNEVRLDLLKADGRAIASTIRHQLLKPWVGFNYGWDTPVPKYRAVWDEAEDYGKKMEWIGKAMEKAPVSRKWFYSQFNIPEPDKGEETLGGPQPVAETKAKLVVAKAAPAKKDGPDQVAETLGTDIAPLLDGMVDPVRDLVMKAKSLEEIRDGILSLYDGMDSNELAGAMGQAFATADLLGRYEVTSE